MKNTILLGIIFFPFVASAAWWNPLSWFDANNTYVQSDAVLETEVSETASADENSYNKPDTSGTSSPVEVREVVREVTKTETVVDPKLQTQIDFLTKENTKLANQLQACKSESSIISSSDLSPLEVRKDLVIPILSELRRVIDEYTWTSGSIVEEECDGSAVEVLVWSFNDKSGGEVGELDTNYAYCEDWRLSRLLAQIDNIVKIYSLDI